MVVRGSEVDMGVEARRFSDRECKKNDSVAREPQRLQDASGLSWCSLLLTTLQV